MSIYLRIINRFRSLDLEEENHMLTTSRLVGNYRNLFKHNDFTLEVCKDLMAQKVRNLGIGCWSNNNVA